MICRQAKMAIIERELEPLSPSGQAELERHLARCPACAAIARAEARLAADLAAVGALGRGVTAAAPPRTMAVSCRASRCRRRWLNSAWDEGRRVFLPLA